MQTNAQTSWRREVIHAHVRTRRSTPAEGEQLPRESHRVPRARRHPRTGNPSCPAQRHRSRPPAHRWRPCPTRRLLRIAPAGSSCAPFLAGRAVEVSIDLWCVRVPIPSGGMHAHEPATCLDSQVWMMHLGTPMMDGPMSMPTTWPVAPTALCMSCVVTPLYVYQHVNRAQR